MEEKYELVIHGIATVMRQEQFETPKYHGPFETIDQARECADRLIREGVFIASYSIQKAKRSVRSRQG